MTKVKAALFVFALAACGGKSKPAEPVATTPPPTEEAKPQETPPAEPAGPGAEALAQAALAEQYDAGKKIYGEKDCDTCHGDSGEGSKSSPALIGDMTKLYAETKASKLRKGVTFKTAADVVAFVKAKMPLKSPNTLSDDEAAAVTAWMLSESKVNITAKLDASNAASVNLR